MGLSDYEFEVAMSEHRYWYITLILNIGLGILDERKLKAAGVDTNDFGKMVFIVPVYLWKRAKALSQGPAYFWTWMGAFLVTMFV